MNTCYCEKDDKCDLSDSDILCKAFIKWSVFIRSTAKKLYPLETNA